MGKGMGKRAYHKQDMDKLNRVALITGAVVAGIVLFLMAISFLAK